MKNKNILIVTPTEVRPSETFIQAHIERLEFNIFHLYGNELFLCENGIPLVEKYNNKRFLFSKILYILPYYIVFRRKRKRQKRYSKENLLKKFLFQNKIDIVIAEYGTTGAQITPVCKDSNIPLIVHFHGFDASRYDILDKFNSDYISMFDYAKYIIGVSKRMINDLKHLGCPPEKLMLNPYGPNPIFFDAKPHYQSNNIIAIGRQTYKKAPYLSILAFYKAWQQHNELHLHFVGTGEIEEISKNIVKSLRLGANVHFHGVKTPKEIISLVNESFLFIQHSVVAENGDSEGTPVAILEAGAAGLPVVATTHAGIADVVIEKETGFLVKENDIEGMSDSMLTLFENRSLAKEMGENARNHIAQNYSMEKHINCLQKLIDNA